MPVQKLAVLDPSGHMVFFLMQVMRLLVTDVVASCARDNVVIVVVPYGLQ